MTVESTSRSDGSELVDVAWDADSGACRPSLAPKTSCCRSGFFVGGAITMALAVGGILVPD
jgi:hypothetical protein